MSASQELAEFVASLTYEELSPQTIKQAKLCIIDTLGCCLFGKHLEWSKITHRYVEKLGVQGEATTLGYWTQTGAAQAALVNGTLAHSFELDDVHDEGLCHPGATVIPAAMNVAEATNATGKQLLVAVVAGYEVMARVGMAAGGSHNLRGFHPTATHGTFGAATSAAKLLFTDAPSILRTFGIAASFAAGLMQFSKESGKGSGMIKRLHAGKAAENGVVAALLAQEGLTSVDAPLEGSYGYLRAYSDEPDEARLTQELGRTHEILNVTRKPYSCCRFLHAAIDALLELMAEHHFVATDVERIDVGVSRRVLEGNALYEPRSVMAAQYMMPFNLAATVLDDIKDPRIYTESNLIDSPIQSFSHKVRLNHSQEMERIFPKLFGADVSVTLVSGQVLRRVVQEPKGNPSTPLSVDEIKEKYFRLSAESLPHAIAEQVLARIESLEQAGDIASVLGPVKQYALLDTAR